MKTIEEIRQSLLNHIEAQKLMGFDPHDGLESPLIQRSILNKSRIAKLAFLQFIKRSPINFRPLFGIKPHCNPKAIGLYLSSLCNLNLLNDRSDEIQLYIDKLRETTNPFYPEYAWGYPFDWQARAFFQPKNYPTVVASSFVGQALLDIYEKTGREECLDMAVSTAEFFMNHLNRSKVGEYFSFSYSPADTSVVFNATALGARHLARICKITGNRAYGEIAHQAIMPLIEFQNQDGSWAYGLQSHHTWIDSFHTGYNLECLFETQKYLEHSSFNSAIEKGLEFYLSELFEDDGTSKYYTHSRYPIDSHAPAQLLVTLAKLGQLTAHGDLVEKVVRSWISNLYSEKTNLFYYQKNNLFTNKINYLRWTQSWAFYGLSFLDTDELDFST